MYDWISALKPEQRALDVASGPGSFPAAWFGCTLVWLDEDTGAFGTAARPPEGPYYRVFGQSGRLPFADASFDLVICNHALEHIADPAGTLKEMARVLKPGGRAYVAVPNGHGLCDAIYRFLFEGGGHVNRFRRAEVVDMVERHMGLRLARWQKLYSSFAYLHRLRELLVAPPPGLAPRLLSLRRLPGRSLMLLQRLLYWGTRAADRWLRTDLAVYGWAFYFEHQAGAPAELPAYLNVCRYCGAGTRGAELERVPRFSFRCANCNGINPYFPPFRGTL